MAEITQEREGVEMAKMWRQFSPFWHILTGAVTIIFLAGIYWGKASAYDGRISDLETAQRSQNTVINEIQRSQAVTAQEVHDLHEWMGKLRHEP